MTTTAVHMSRLQGLKECDYTAKTKTCTCYTIRGDSNPEFHDTSARYVFDQIDECGMVHGALYSCLRALFGLSVVGVLVAVISCMLVYQLLSHERKKMYWEQLELRCRSLYNGQPPPHGLATIGQAGAPIVDPMRCRCCEQCHAHGPGSVYPWHTESTGIRFWTGPAGNFYSPNPGGEEAAAMRMGTMTGSGIRNAAGAQGRMPGGNASTTGWSWPRMPWQRNEAQRFRHPVGVGGGVTPSSPDSQYGFSNNGGNMVHMDGNAGQGQAGGMSQSNGGYSVIGSAPYGIWGPPPPYSDPNSPARRAYQYIQSPGAAAAAAGGHHQQQQLQQSMIMNDPLNGNFNGGNFRQSQQLLNVVDCHHQQHQQQSQPPQLHHHQQQQQHCGGGGGQNSSSTEGGGGGPHSLEFLYPTQQQQPHNHERRENFAVKPSFQSNKDFYENSDPTNTQGSGNTTNAMVSINRGDTNSLPTRKTKKRVVVGEEAKSYGLNSHQPATPRVNVQDVFSGGVGEQPPATPRTTASGIELGRGEMEQTGGGGGVGGGDSKTFSSQTKETESLLKNILDPSSMAESEVYFGDVSSCCNVSVQQDNLYDETQQRQSQQQQRMVVAEEDEETDYLAQRFGNREASVRSRMPFPQNSGGGGVADDQLTRSKLIPPMVQPRKSLMLINKEPSRHSMCSMDSDADVKTEITDLSPNTPGAGVPMNLNEYQGHFANVAAERPEPPVTTNFVASFAYSQSQEAVRRPTAKVTPANNWQPKGPEEEDVEGGEADCSPQYEVIPGDAGGVRPQATNAYLGHHVPQNTGNQAIPHLHGVRSPKSLKVTPIKRRNISTDISTIIGQSIQSDVSLMYQDRRDSALNSGPASGDTFEYNGQQQQLQGREGRGDDGGRL